jgi:alkyl sulfatase BDS1-like metallo-beta-lactamase superfamily hydrolase
VTGRSSSGEKDGAVKAFRVLQRQDVRFRDPRPDIHVAALPIAGCAWVDTEEGVVLIDTLISEEAARQARERIQGEIKYIIYTHGHGDHVGGTRVFMDDRPEVIASAYLPDRLEKYKMLDRYRARSSAIQFNIPKLSGIARDWVYPTRTFLGEMTFSLGGKTFELHTARAETDDACWVWVPELGAAFIGDLMIGSFPNIGNPWKPTRFTLDWAKSLEEVRAKTPELVLCNGAAIVYEGDQALAALDANIEVIRSLHDQVVEYINQGMHITEMIHAVEIPDHLKGSPYLRLIYSRPEFFVFNTYRWYHGYFDDNPANLLPRPQKEVNSEIFGLIGDPDKILGRARALHAQAQTQLALQVLDVLIQAEPEHLEARRLHIELLERLGSEDYCLMSRNAWVYFIERDRELLRSRGGG